MEPVLELIDVCKTYFGDEGSVIKANDHVNFRLNKGEIHALLGENGAGKSTLVKNLTQQPDSGNILINGSEVMIDNPLDSINHGIGISHQDLSKSLIERHSIAENLLSIVQGNLFSINVIEKKILETLERYELGALNPRMKVWKLSGGEKQRVEILKALITNPEIIVLDEPTSMLTPNETRQLFSLLKKLKKDGKSVLIITHHLEEAIEISDRITVMRQGQVVGTLDNKRTMEFKNNIQEGLRELAKLMVGREVLFDYGAKSELTQADHTVMDVENLRVTNDMALEVVKGVNFTLKKGRILGLAGIAGNGQKELIEAILKIRKPEGGKIFIRARDTTDLSLSDIRQLGVSYIPEDRNKAIIADLSVRENLILNDYKIVSGYRIPIEELIEKSDQLIEEYQIKTPSPLDPVRSLSGGNKQKVIVARELSRNIEDDQLIIIAENPTIGLDVQTTEFVRKELLKMREKKSAILLVSSDLREIMELSDEIVVIYNGTISESVLAKDATREKIGLLMGGVTMDEMEEVIA